MMYEWIKDYYEKGYYNNDPSSDMYVGYFVESNDITVEEYQKITGSEEYVPPQN